MESERGICNFERLDFEGIGGDSKNWDAVKKLSTIKRQYLMEISGDTLRVSK